MWRVVDPAYSFSNWMSPERAEIDFARRIGRTLSSNCPAVRSSAWEKSEWAYYRNRCIVEWPVSH